MKAGRRRSIVLRAINVWRRFLDYDPKKDWAIRGGAEYFEKYPPVRSRHEEEILKVLENEKFDRLIDIGCGYGRYLKSISSRFPKVRLIGVDISPTQLEKARDYLKECNNVELQEVDGAHLPYRDKYFHISLTYGCMIHVPHKSIVSFIKEVQRISHRGIFIESKRIRTALKGYLSPEIGWYSHNYEKLFKDFPHEVLWSRQTEEILERLFYVDLDS